MTPVVIGSELYGDSPGIARDITAGGCLVEIPFPLPLGSTVSVHFACLRPDGQCDELVARAEVRRCYCLNATIGGEPTATRAIVLKFVGFDDQVPPERLLDGWPREVLLH